MPSSVHRAVRLDFPLSLAIFRSAFPEQRAATFVLEGGGAPRLDRFVFMGARPVASFRVERLRDPEQRLLRDESGRVRGRIVIEDKSTRRNASGDPFDALRAFLATHAPEPRTRPDDDYPFPFRAGIVGCIGYECGQLLERMPSAARPSSGMPDVAFGFYDWVLAMRRDNGESWLSLLGRGATEADAEADAITKKNDVIAALEAARSTRSPAAAPRGPRSTARPEPKAALSRAEYVGRVGVAQQHIASGDAYEICLTNTLRAPFDREDAWALFEELQTSNAAPFAAMLDLPEGAIVSSSPERFLSLDAHGFAESRPIKGTRPRGSDPADDARLVAELTGSEKDRAENAMIVDLVRNDLGRVCRFGTVETPDLFAIESYATVHQLVSTIRGELTPGRDAFDLLRACFPPGSMTGAPKIEAMTILEQLEPVERGIYSGALGWIDPGGAMDLSVVIRTAVIQDGVVTFSVGGAVVADSDPAMEYEETEHKARALVRALGVVGS